MLNRSRPSPVLCGSVAALLLVSACKKDEPTTNPTAENSSRAPGPAAAATGSPSGAAASGLACNVDQEKVWTSGANLRTGITPTEFADGRVAVGFGLWNRPTVLVFDRDGNGEVVKPPLLADHPLSKEVKPEDGTRELQRVTPAVLPGGGIRVYADFRDKLKSAERRIQCGATDADHALLVYEGKPLLDVDDSGKNRAKPVAADKTAAVAASATPVASDVPPPAKATISVSPRATISVPGLASAAPPTLSAAPPAASTGATPAEPAKQRELRDCRSIVDPGGAHAWAVGSELVGETKDDKTKWHMRFVAQPSNAGRMRLYDIPLGASPTKLYTFESPVARRLAPGQTVVSARYQGQLYGWLLDSNDRLRGSAHVYRGGYPTLPHVYGDGADVLMLLSQKTGAEQYGLWLGRFPIADLVLPKALEALPMDVEGGSAFDPTLAIVGEQRFIALESGPRKSPALLLVPVDKGLHAVGKPITIARGDAPVDEAQVLALAGGKLVVVYLRTRAGKPELVSATVSCH